MKFKLTSKEHYDIGEIGWEDSRVACAAYGPIVGGGVGLAHDLLEHAAFGSVADEIEAHGAMYWIRYEGGYCNAYSGRSITLEDFSYEWENLAVGLSNEPFLPTPPRTTSLDSVVEEDISTIMEKGLETLREHTYFQDEIGRLEKVFRAYFRRGYRKAQKRYKGLGSCHVAWLFGCLVEKLKPYAEPQYEGRELTVRIWPKEGRIEIREEYVD